MIWWNAFFTSDFEGDYDEKNDPAGVSCLVGRSTLVFHEFAEIGNPGESTHGYLLLPARLTDLQTH